MPVTAARVVKSSGRPNVSLATRGRSARYEPANGDDTHSRVRAATAGGRSRAWTSPLRTRPTNDSLTASGTLGGIGSDLTRRATIRAATP